ncbi:porin [Edaphovirga cremea]|uniref:porin n=1 Tax=Edaphovirga cremea TaxID=2267246 RepID=UPI001FE2AC71|nr:porin [Edaphovirga cremea]
MARSFTNIKTLTNIKNLTLLATLIGSALSASAMADTSVPVQPAQPAPVQTPIPPAPAYTATQTKGITVYQNEDTSVGLLGSIRLTAKTDSKKSQEHSIQNNDSRIGLAIRHNINAQRDYVIGYAEMGVYGLDSSTKNDDNDVYMRQTYAGVGSETYGVATFGKQFAPTDWALGIDTTYQFGGKAKHDTAGMSTDIVGSAAVYSYFGDNFSFGLMGQGNDDVDKVSFGSGWGDGPTDMHDAFADGSAHVNGAMAVTAAYKWDNGFSVSGAFAFNNYDVDAANGGGGYSGSTYSSGINAKYTTNVGEHVWYNAVQATYYVNQVDDGVAARRGANVYQAHPGDTSDKESILGLEAASQLKITPQWSVYANFDWTQGYDAMEGQTFQSTTIGTDYWLGKNAVAYLEYGYEKYNDNGYYGSVDDHLGAIGLRVFI